MNTLYLATPLWIYYFVLSIIIPIRVDLLVNVGTKNSFVGSLIGGSFKRKEEIKDIVFVRRRRAIPWRATGTVHIGITTTRKYPFSQSWLFRKYHEF
jgi:hypothetical protein